ncbi:hypothetical protein X551_04669 [Methylibium sp. T29]|nr:hypothetical protein X551_04669 [Methylibium sp. T29]EWS57269.1 hypothetical protein Y694_04683 [Methylibium sp. T29-B]
MLGHAAALRVAERVGEEHLGVARVGLEQQDVGVGVELVVLAQAELHARADQRAERLAQHLRQAAVDQPRQRRPGTVRRPVRVGGAVVGHQRIQADQQVQALVEQDRGMQRLAQHAIDVAAAVDLDRREQSGQRGAGLHGERDRHVVVARQAEGPGVAAVEVDRHQHQPARQRAEVVAAAGRAEHAAQVLVDRAVGEQAGRHGAAELVEHLAAGGEAQRIVQSRAAGQTGRPREALRELAPGRPHQQRGVEHVVRRPLVLDEGAAQLTRPDAVGQSGGHEAAGRHAHVALALSEAQASDRFLERAQCADLVDRAQWPAAGQRETDARHHRNWQPPGSMARLAAWT